MVPALALLLSLQLFGEGVAAALGLPLPGPVIGMATLFVGLMVFGAPAAPLDATARGFLDNLGLLFVPAGVGVSLHLGRFATEGAALGASVLGATLVALVTVAWSFVLIDRLTRGRRTEAEQGPTSDDKRGAP